MVLSQCFNVNGTARTHFHQNHSLSDNSCLPTSCRFDCSSVRVLNCRLLGQCVSTWWNHIQRQGRNTKFFSKCGCNSGRSNQMVYNVCVSLNFEWLALHSGFWCSSCAIICSAVHHSMGQKLHTHTHKAVWSKIQCIQFHTYTTIQITKIKVKQLCSHKIHRETHASSPCSVSLCHELASLLTRCQTLRIYIPLLVECKEHWQSLVSSWWSIIGLLTIIRFRH